ncbi:MAG: hypothetical protein HONBIEJF_01876 [Fimbriimonadaceae bacterium]|nr:hypothetical protein [Fimbriimonadaceae bacterium]
MEFLIPVICLLVGAVLGVAAWMAAQRPRMADLEVRGQRLQSIEAELVATKSGLAAAEERASQAEEWKQQAMAKEIEISELLVGSKELETRLAEKEKAFDEQREMLEQMKEKLSDAFKALAGEALNKNNQAFLDLAKQSLEAYNVEAKKDLEARQAEIKKMTEPIEKTLDGMNRSIKDFNEKYENQMGGVSKQLSTVIETNSRLQQETGNLVKAMRNSTQKGKWGELQLRRIVELSGMQLHCDFVSQVREATEDGAIQPDVIVRLPGDRCIVIDAKAPTSNYLDAVEEGATEERKVAALRQHALQVKEHMKSLGRKEYWSKLSQSPDFVIMFLPLESLLSAALETDPTLIETGLRDRVLVCSPTTLIALLQSAAYGWRQEALQENARQIATLGEDIYKRLGNLCGHFSRVGNSLDQAVGHYNSAVGSFESGVLPSARKMKELGVGDGGKEIPQPQPIEKISRRLAAKDIKALVGPGLFDE